MLFLSIIVHEHNFLGVHFFIVFIIHFFFPSLINACLLRCITKNYLSRLRKLVETSAFMPQGLGTIPFADNRMFILQRKMFECQVCLFIISNSECLRFQEETHKPVSLAGLALAFQFHLLQHVQVYILKLEDKIKKCVFE